MEEKTTQNEESKTEFEKIRAKKGTVIPALTLPEFVQAISDVGTRDVKSGSIAILADVMNNSVKSSTFTNKMTAMKGFSGVTVSNDRFELTAIGTGIAFPKSADEKNLSIQKAFASQPVLSKVWNHLKGHNLEEDFLATIMVQIGGVPDDSKAGWAGYFLEAIRAAKLIKKTADGKEIVLSDFIKPGYSKPEEQQLPPGGKDIPPPPPPPQGNAEVLEQLSSSLTGGMKLNAKAGDCYVLVFIDGTLSEEEAAKITTIFEAGTLLIKSRIVKG